MDEVLHRKEVYAWFGAAAYYAQCLEVELRGLALLWYRQKNPHANLTDIDSEDARLSEKTMGTLLRALKNAHLILDEDAVILDKACKKRNYIAHEYFFVHAHDFKTAAKREAMLEELQKLCEVFKTADNLASSISRRLQLSLGWTEEMLEALVKEELRKLHGTA